MGVATVSVPVRSAPRPSDAEDGVKAPGSSVPASVAFASMGTGPVLTKTEAYDGICRIRVTSGTGVPAIAVNNIQLTMDRAPRKVFLQNGGSTPDFYVSSIAGSVINIGSVVAPAASTAYDLEIIVLY